LPPAIPFTDHDTVASVEPFTVAVNVCVAPVVTAVVAGVTATVTAGDALALLELAAPPPHEASARASRTIKNTIESLLVVDC
jgi:hypothetical protein